MRTEKRTRRTIVKMCKSVGVNRHFTVSRCQQLRREIWDDCICFEGQVGSKIIIGLEDDEPTLCIEGWSQDVFA